MTSKIVVNNIEADSGINTITFINEVTAPTFNGNIVGTAATFSGNVDIAGALTYEDVTNVDSVGIVTARSGIHVTGGSVGIGTNNPATKLDVRGGNWTNGDIVVGQSGNAGRVKFRRGADGSDSAFIGFAAADNNNRLNIGVDSGDGTITFQTNSAERLRITSSGNIGIGTDNPISNLQVFGTNGIRITNSANQSATTLLNFESNHPAFRMMNTSGHTTVKFKSDGDSFITSGSLGIGTDNPNTKLHVLDGSLTLESTSATGNSWTYYKNADRTWLVGVRGSSGDALSFYDLTSGTDTERMRITSDGTITTGGLSSTPGTVAAGSFVQAATNAGFFSNGIDGKFGTASSHPLYLQVNGVTKATVTTGGAFSVGTTSPQQPNVPSMHLHSTANDDARIAITTPSKPNSRIGYFGLSNKFGMDVHNGFEVRDASASYATRFAINSTGVVTFGGQSYATATKSGGVNVSSSCYFDIAGSSYVFVKIMIKVGYGGNAGYQMHAQYDYVTCNYYTTGGTATRTDILQVEAANAQFNYSDISISRPSNRTVRVTYAPSSGAGTHYPVLNVSGVFDSITVS